MEEIKQLFELFKISCNLNDFKNLFHKILDFYQSNIDKINIERNYESIKKIFKNLKEYLIKLDKNFYNIQDLKKGIIEDFEYLINYLFPNKKRTVDELLENVLEDIKKKKTDEYFKLENNVELQGIFYRGSYGDIRITQYKKKINKFTILYFDCQARLLYKYFYRQKYVPFGEFLNYLNKYVKINLKKLFKLIVCDNNAKYLKIDAHKSSSNIRFEKLIKELEIVSIDESYYFIFYDDLVKIYKLLGV